MISQVYGGGGNSGATLKNDFVELFNRGSAPVTINGWSLQYSSATGANSTVSLTNLQALTGTIQPGQYFLVGESKGAAGTVDLPSPDATGSLALSGSAGKIFLVSDANALALGASGCPSTSTVVDLVGYGTANCREGTATPLLSNTTAAIRNDACIDSDNNSADFAVLAAAPRNTATTLHACAGSTNPSGVGNANPASVDPGMTTLLTVTVAPGGNPSSAGITVTGDLQAIGGSQTQQFHDDGSNGDVTVGDNIFSSIATVDATVASGTKQVIVTIADTQLRWSTTSISVTVNQPPAAMYPIHAIQGSGDTSPMVGQTVTTTGIVTAVVGNGFYLEAPDGEQDTNNATSEGIYVYGGTSGFLPGDQVQVTGTVSEYNSGVLTTTEITGPSVTLFNHSNPLPSAVEIASVAGGAIDQLERYEGMRVRIVSPQVVAPTGGTSTSDGIFYVTSAGMPRPFREPGLDPGAAVIPGMPAGVPHNDGNSEKVKVDTSNCATPATVAVGDAIPALIGPLGYSSGDFTIHPACPYAVTNTAQAVPLPDRGTDEFTVASFNLLNLTNDTNRLTKASLAIRNILNSPDMIGVQEVNNLTTLQALAAKITSDGGPSYSAVLLGTGSSQNVGLLYRTDRVNVNSSFEVGADVTMDNTNHTTQTPVFDRPPLVVMAKIAPGTTSELPVTLFVNHLRSLISVDLNDTTGDFARRKRLLGAENLATFLSQHQGAGENVVSVGDYNAFEFNDGYVDVLSIIKGQPTSSDKVLLSSADLVDPDLIDLATTKPGSYSYVETGNAQTLDHIVVTSSLTARSYHFEPAHIDADFPGSYASDSTRPERVSDHDPVMAYFTLPIAIPVVTLTPASLDFGAQVINVVSASQSITLQNSGNALSITSIVASPEFSATHNCPASLDSNASCTITVQFSPFSTGTKTGSITIADNASGSPNQVALTGVASLASQTITFPNPGTQTYGVVPITLAATSSSGLSVTYSVTSGPATVSSNTLTVTGVGAVVVRATQSGNGSYTAAAPVSITFAVAPAPTYTLTIANLPTVSIAAGGSATLMLNLTSTNYAGTVTLTPNVSSTAISANSPLVLLSNGGSGSSTLTITTTTSSATHAPATPWKSGGAIVFCAVLLAVPFGVRRKRVCAVLLAALAISSVGFLMACGGSGTTNPPTPKTPRTYTVTVRPSGSGPVTDPATVTITVTVT